MFGSAVSRWTMPHFDAALIFFLLAQIAMVGGLTFPVTSLLAPTTLAAVHLLTIGWLTLLMVGALHQFVPVITAKGSAAGTPALVALVAMILGLAGMEAGFLALGGILPMASLAALPLGGVLVLLGAVIAGTSIARTLWQARPLPFPARFVAVGLACLLAVLVMGIILATAFVAPRHLAWGRAFTDGLRLHFLAGLVGWFTLTALGVSYRLLSMFTLAPEERGHLGAAVLWLTAGGFAAAWLLDLARAQGLPVPVLAVTIAAVAAGLGLALYVVDMARLYRARRRQKLELNTGMALPAIAALALCLALATWLGVRGASEQTLGALGYLFVFGWLSGLALSQLYKIVPFLTWLARYGSVLGRQKVPRVQDLVDEQRDRPWFLLYFAAVAAGTVLIVLGQPVLWRIAVLGQLLATLMIVRAIWLARFGVPRAPPAVPSARPFPMQPPIAS